jgi:hypothetical protein
MRPMPSIAAGMPDDADVYMVLDDFGGRLGRAWREVGEERTEREMLITDLLDGQYENPARIVAFNTARGWSRDVSRELAVLIADDGFDVPPFLQMFVERHAGGWPAQLALPLRHQVT